MNKYFFTSTREFKANLRKIHTYNFLSDHIYSSERFQQIFIQKREILKIFPRMYPIFDPKEELRKIPIQKYVIIYKVKNYNIHFIDIIPTSSNKYNQMLKYIN